MSLRDQACQAIAESFPVGIFIDDHPKAEHHAGGDLRRDVIGHLRIHEALPQ